MKKERVHWPSYTRRLRKNAEKSLEEGRYPEEEIRLALSVPEPYYRSYALSEIALRLHGKGMKYEDVWEKAVRSAEEIEPEWKKEEMLEKLASIGHRCSTDIFSLPSMLTEKEMRMKLVSKIARLVRGDDGHLAKLWERSGESGDSERYEILRILVHHGLSESLTGKFMENLSDEKKELLREYMRRGRGNRKDRKREKRESAGRVEPLKGPEPAFTMALYNTYRGKADENHYRNIARAAALCYAFDINLALIGFPFEDAEECAERTVKNTRVGKGGEYLRELEKAGRFVLYPNIDSIEGKIVATSSHPDPKKTIKPGDIAGKTTFVLGLGHQGLPASVMRRADFHLEFTGKGASLETCTAMGVLAYILGKRT